MVERKVTATGKEGGDIVSLCNHGERWSPKKKADAITDIQGGSVRYYVQVGQSKAYVHVVNHPKHGKYLRTGADSSSKNNLDELPNC